MPVMTRKRTGWRMSLGVVVVATVVLAACGGDAEPAADESAAATTSSTSASSATVGSSSEADGGATVEVATTDFGDVLVDAEGRTLYLFDSDDVDTSACTEGCLDSWPPVLADAVTAGDGITGDLATFTREDGDIQVTINGLPLYHYAADAGPGDVNGQAVGDVWWVVDPAGEKVTETSAGAATSDPAGSGDPY